MKIVHILLADSMKEMESGNFTIRDTLLFKDWECRCESEFLFLIDPYAID